MVPKFTPVADMTYTQAVAEIEEILRMMQADSLDIDLLAAYTRRATELLTECRRRLTDTDRELQSILNPQQ
ncbi:exodeoxyribonuclease VII small subunit [Muribaculum intestinale]|uniref:Exodeoxyribonuclease VII small subunit n=1 Tax=Muribaculum intestinale TaxID=1796646 RepID=A0A4S2FZH8_9BACT|nr:exodeoxyribonuclease VII small subunit [Muribaculum intestinale]MYM11793.1 exodeoxyribonuclease VII small subunit [Muribaculum intestinale]TGY74893.1 exodeoxyribonuclease VII small subunit [Muribaculum intestinale]